MRSHAAPARETPPRARGFPLSRAMTWPNFGGARATGEVPMPLVKRPRIANGERWAIGTVRFGVRDWAFRASTPNPESRFHCRQARVAPR